MILLANLIATVHGLFFVSAAVLTVLAIIGILRHSPRAEFIFFSMALLMGGSIALWKACFLTLWEQQLRRIAAPSTTYNGGFIEHYLNKIGLFPSGALIMWINIGMVVAAIVATIAWHVFDTMRARSLKAPGMA